VNPNDCLSEEWQLIQSRVPNGANSPVLPTVAQKYWLSYLIPRIVGSVANFADTALQ